MKTLLSRTTALAILTALSPLLAHAHEGHGLGGTHWHATDVLGFVVVVIAAVAIWAGRK